MLVFKWIIPIKNQNHPSISSEMELTKRILQFELSWKSGSVRAPVRNFTKSGHAK